jgi:hypothetical protein
MVQTNESRKIGAKAHLYVFSHTWGIVIKNLTIKMQIGKGHSFLTPEVLYYILY